MTGVTILDGDFDASSTNGAGIGTGRTNAYAPQLKHASVTSGLDSVSIMGGHIVGTSSYGAGIGTGQCDCTSDAGTSDFPTSSTSRASIGSISIFGGNVSGTCSGDGAGLGAGRCVGTTYGSPGATVSGLVDRVSIHGGDIAAASRGAGAGIGPGTSRVGGGKGRASVMSNVTELYVLAGARVNATSAKGAALGPIPRVTIGDASIVGATGTATIGPSAWTISGAPRVAFDYAPVSSKEALAGVALLHFGRIVSPYAAVYVLTIRQINGTFERTVIFDGSRATGCGFSVPQSGSYAISAAFASDPAFRGPLAHDGDLSFAAPLLGDNFFPTVEARLPTPRPSPPRTPLATATPSEAFAESRAPQSEEIAPTLSFAGSADHRSSLPFPASQLSASAALGASAPLFGHSEAFGASHPMQFPQSEALGASAPLTMAAEFPAAAALRTLSSRSILVPILVAVLVVVALIVAVVAWRCCGGKSKGEGREAGTLAMSLVGFDPAVTGEFVTIVNPDAEDMADDDAFETMDD
jgi:hypothetical protein